MTRVASVLTHRRAIDTANALAALIAAAARAGVRCASTPRRRASTASRRGEGIEVDAPLAHDVDLCVVMGGDGTILTALREYAGTSVPVFAVNFGEVGFLATLDPDGLDADFDRAFSGDFETLELPGITVGRPEGNWMAMNDISVHRKPGFRVADLAYALAGEEIGACAATASWSRRRRAPPATTSPTAGRCWPGRGGLRRLVHRAAFADRALAGRRARRPAHDQQPLARGAGGDPRRRAPGDELAPGEDIHVEFARATALLAQLPGASFYHRLRERFGRLAR